MVTRTIPVTLDPRLCATSFRWFYLFGSLAVMTKNKRFWTHGFASEVFASFAVIGGCNIPAMRGMAGDEQHCTSSFRF